MDTQIEISYVPIDSLKPADYNPRKSSPDQGQRLKDSLTAFGFVDPIIVNSAPNRKNIIIGGHFRWRTAREMGFKEAPVVFVNIPDINREKELNVRLNKNTGDFDYALLSSFDVDMLSDIGFSSAELDAIFAKDTTPDENAVPEYAPARAHRGDIFLLGDHRVMCGDSCSFDDVNKLMDGKKAQMVFTDPPYNVDYEGTAGKIKNDKFKNKQAFYQFLYDSISLMKMFVSGDVYIAMTSSELHTLQRAFEDAGGHWSTFIIWVKNTFTLGRSNYQRQYEPVLYGWFEGSTHYWAGRRDLGDVLKDQIQDDGMGNYHLTIGDVQTDIWEFPKPKKNKIHPTMKPVELVDRAVVNSSERKNIVLDLFLGSGTSIISCEKNDRVCYGMELDPKFVDVIIKRWEDFTGRKAVLLKP